MIKKIIVTCVSLALSASALAQKPAKRSADIGKPKQVITGTVDGSINANSPTEAAFCLNDVYQLSLAQDPIFANARSTWLANLERYPQARSGYLPLVTLAASTTWNDSDVDSRDPTVNNNRRRYNSNGYSVVLSQPLFRLANWIQIRQANLQITQADLQLAASQQDLIIRTAQAYFDVLLAEDTMRFAQAQKQAIGQQLEQAKRNFEVGNSTIVDTHDAQARFDLSNAQEIAALNDLEIKRRALEKLTGQPIPRIAGIAAQAQITAPVPNRMDDWVSDGLQSSLAVQVQQLALAIAQKEINVQRAAYLPTIDAVASYGQNAIGSGNINSNTLIAGSGSDTTTKAISLQLNMPLYQGGFTSSRVREVIALEQAARSNLENVNRSTAQDIRQNYLNIVNGIAQINALQTAVVSSQSSLDSSRLGQEVGVRTSIDVLNAQQQLFSAQRDLAQARYNTILNQLRLKLAVGTLTDDDVTQVNQLLSCLNPKTSAK